MSVSRSACVCFTFETFQLANSLLEKIETSADFMARENFQTKKNVFYFQTKKKRFLFSILNFFVICVLCGWKALAGSSDKVDRVFFKWQQNPSHFCSYFINSNDKIEVRSDWWFGADPCHRSIALKFIKNHLPSQLFFVKLCGESFFECVEKPILRL